MEIYLDANATTPVLDEARDAALAAMTEDFGNPSSGHSAGLRARALLDSVRARARRVLGAPSGRLLFQSGATEGIQTAVLSALRALRDPSAGGPAGHGPRPTRLLYGATEHKAVPEALRHWNTLLGLHLEVLAIPVDREGRHDLDWLRAQAPHAGLVCTMAANNETGIVSDLDGIASALSGSPALWLVDSVQALGKLPQQLDREVSGRRIDYATYSGHKLYAPKGIGLLYVRDGAPFTPLMAGGGQEAASRAGTENMAGIAALGAVLAALEEGRHFADPDRLHGWRQRLAHALSAAFPGLVFNAAPKGSLPTTLNFAVPGLPSRVLLDLFDAAGVRVSAGSACSAARAEPSHVLQAMGLPAWQAESAVRLSFGPLADEAFIAEACRRIQTCGDVARATGLGLGDGSRGPADSPRITAVQGPDALGPAPARAAAQPAGGPIAHDGSRLLTSGSGPGEPLELDWAAFQALAAAEPALLLVDVREAHEQQLGGVPADPLLTRRQSVPLTAFDNALPDWLALPQDRPLVFLCRSGARSARAALALRGLGRCRAYSLAGGLALWPAARTLEPTAS